MTDRTATLTFTVTDDDTAAAPSARGSLPVLGTPRLLAWCEAATCAAIEPALADGETSVGTRVAARAPRRQRGRRSEVEVTAVRVVRRRPAAPLHRRGPAPARTARSSAPAR